MKLRRSCAAVLAAGITLSSAAVVSAAPTEGDSAYRWGRWAVLSPAAGGAEPYVASDTPGAQYNARPEDPGFERNFTLNDPGSPPVVVPNPPGDGAPPGDPRGDILPPMVVPNPPGTQPPTGDPRGAS